MAELWDNAPTKHYVQCYFCEKSRNATEIGVVHYRDTDGLDSRCTLMRCDTCSGALLFLQQDYGEGIDSDDYYRVWPAPVRQLSRAIPRALSDIHAEARRCFDARAYTAAVVMVGRTLEGVCRMNDIESPNLYKGLKELREAGLIDDRLFEWTTELRVLRNEGAHFTGQLVSKEDARDALQLCEALLDYMYVLTARFKEFKARRQQKGGESSAEATDTSGEGW